MSACRLSSQLYSKGASCLFRLLFSTRPLTTIEADAFTIISKVRLNLLQHDKASIWHANRRFSHGGESPRFGNLHSHSAKSSSDRSLRHLQHNPPEIFILSTWHRTRPIACHSLISFPPSGLLSEIDFFFLPSFIFVSGFRDAHKSSCGSRTYTT